MTIDENTGLPELPEGFFWRVEEHGIQIWSNPKWGDWMNAETGAERDAAVAAIERVRAATEKHKHWNEGCGWDVPAIEVLAALDGGEPNE